MLKTDRHERDKVKVNRDIQHFAFVFALNCVYC